MASAARALALTNRAKGVDGYVGDKPKGFACPDDD
jgi:hypothetical protein